MSLRTIALAAMLSAVGASSGAAQQQLDEPFTPSARWAHYLHRTYAPSRFASLAADTAIDHLLRDPACWDGAASSYGRRFARSYERRWIRNTAELAAGLLTGEDLRYRRSESSVFHQRVWNALRSSVAARMPDGSLRPAYTRFFAGTLATAATSNWTRQTVDPSCLFHSAAWSVLDQFQTNLLDEFSPDLHRIGKAALRAVAKRRFRSSGAGRQEAGNGEGVRDLWPGVRTAPSVR